MLYQRKEVINNTDLPFVLSIIPGEDTEMSDLQFNMTVSNFDTESGFTLEFNFTNPLMVGAN